MHGYTRHRQFGRAIRFLVQEANLLRRSDDAVLVSSFFKYLLGFVCPCAMRETISARWLRLKSICGFWNVGFTLVRFFYGFRFRSPCDFDTSNCWEVKTEEQRSRVSRCLKEKLESCQMWHYFYLALWNTTNVTTSRRCSSGVRGVMSCGVWRWLGVVVFYDPLCSIVPPH